MNNTKCGRPNASNDYESELKLKEYESLREEILQNRKYLFERPLVIVTAAIATAAAVDELSYLVFLPPVITCLLLINFHFTINRFRSLARISAYQRQVLEPASKYCWPGWENALTIYIEYWKDKKMFRDDLDFARIPNKSILKDTPILLHYASVLLMLIGASAMVAWKEGWLDDNSLCPFNPVWVPYLCAGITLLFSVMVAVFSFPTWKINGSFEVERVKWKLCMEPFLLQKYVKQETQTAIAVEPALGANMDEKLDEKLKDILGIVNSLQRFAETKNAFMVGFCGAVLVAVVDKADFLPFTGFYVGYISGLALALTLIISIGISVVSYYPKLKNKLSSGSDSEAVNKTEKGEPTAKQEGGGVTSSAALKDRPVAISPINNVLHLADILKYDNETGYLNHLARKLQSAEITGEKDIKAGKDGGSEETGGGKALLYIPTGFQKDYANQIIKNAEIAMKKFKFFAKAWWVLVIGTGLAAVALLVEILIISLTSC